MKPLLITVYKFKPSIQSFKECFNENFQECLEDLQILDFNNIDELEEVEGGILFIENPQKVSEVPWLSFLNSTFEEDEKFTSNSESLTLSALVILKVPNYNSDNFYALRLGPAGYKRLNKNEIESDFGIRAAMNICGKSDLKQIQKRAHDLVFPQTEMQASADSNIDVYNIFEDSEFLQIIKQFSRKKCKFINELWRKDCIRIELEIFEETDWVTLVNSVRYLGEMSMKDDFLSYVRSYKWFQKVIDKNVQQNLDDNLVTQIIADHSITSNVSLVLSLGQYRFQYLKDSDIPFFDPTQSTQSKPHSDESVLNECPSIHEILSQERKFSIDDLDISNLKKTKIPLWDTENEQFAEHEWTLYECLIAEVNLHGNIYILSKGNWKKVGKSFGKELANSIQSIKSIKADYLPDNISIWDEEHEVNHERVYNLAASETSDKLFLFDNASIEIDGDNRYEICDLLHSKKALIHVKRYTSRSDSICYLFTQGQFYADAFLNDGNCRASMLEYIERESDKDIDDFTEIIPDESTFLNPSEYKIVFCILSTNDELCIEKFPMIAQHMLVCAHSFITELGYKCYVTIKKIKIRSSR